VYRTRCDIIRRFRFHSLEREQFRSAALLFGAFMKWVLRILLVFLLSSLAMTGALALPSTAAGDFSLAHTVDAAFSTSAAMPHHSAHCTAANDTVGHDHGHACCTIACALHCGAFPSTFHFSPIVAAACTPVMSTDAVPASLTHAPPWRPPIV
jgi:hypothetical protein